MGLRLPLFMLLLLPLAACSPARDQAPADTVDARPAPQGPMLQSISLRRVGGIAGFDDRILINPGGDIITSGRALGMRYGHLTPEQVSQLLTLFNGFDQLDTAYPPPEGARDDLQYQLTYGPRVVRASTANPDLPGQFRAIVQFLEQLAGSLPGRQGNERE